MTNSDIYDKELMTEYNLITWYYGCQMTKRSKVPLINHINEGLIILDIIQATENAKRAFCLHPLVQDDYALESCYEKVIKLSSVYVFGLAMEYRYIANSYLSDKIPLQRHMPIKLSPLNEVNMMLIADKVQNYKDFITYHKGTHPRSDELTEYFEKWLDVLSIDDMTYNMLCERIDHERKIKEFAGQDGFGVK